MTVTSRRLHIGAGPRAATGVFRPAEEQEQSVTSGQTEESQQAPEVPPEQIVRNGLARSFGESVLRSNHGRF